MSGTRLLAAILVLVVTGAVIAGIVVIGPPSEERTRRLDDRRVEDLRRISSSARVYYTRRQRLPASLDELAAEPGIAFAPQDPQTGEPYGYRTLDSERYEVCAVFERTAAGERAAGFWSHGAGRQCFTLKAEDIP